MAYCSKCGAELIEGKKFCHKCGEPISDVESEKEAVSLQSKRKATYVLLGVLGVLLLIILGAIAYTEYSEKRETRLAREKFVADSLAQARQDSISLAGQREQLRKDSIENAHRLSLQEPYLNLLDKYIEKNELDGEYYFLYDINGDDYPEMWLQVLEGDEFKLLVYSNIGGKAVLLFSEDVGHPYHHGFYRGENYILKDFGHMGYQETYKYYFEKGAIKSKLIYKSEAESQEEAEYKEISEPEVTTYEITDKSPIYDIN